MCIQEEGFKNEKDLFNCTVAGMKPIETPCADCMHDKDITKTDYCFACSEDGKYFSFEEI